MGITVISSFIDQLVAFSNAFQLGRNVMTFRFNKIVIKAKHRWRCAEMPKAGHRSTLAFLRFCVIAATGICKHTQVELLWITWRIRRISAFPSNSERLDASVFTSTLPATKRNSRTISTRATDVIFERKHCSRRRSHTQVEITSPHEQLGNSETITRNSWHGARIF